MTSVFIADLRVAGLVDDREDEPPILDTALTAGREVRVWPTSGLADNRIPQRGDYILFVATHPGRALLRGVGQVYDCTHSQEAEHLLKDFDITISDSDLPLATIVNYQTLTRPDRPPIDEILEGAEPGIWRGRSLSKVPEDVLEHNDFVPPIRGLERIDNLDTTRFESSPGPPDGNEPPNEQPPFDGDESGGIDRTGPLLTQQYSSRDTVRAAAKDSLQVTILLFGVIVAGLSFLRNALQDGIIETSILMIAGGLAIGIGAVLAVAVFVWTVVNPRPESGSLSEFHARINGEVISKHDDDRNNRLIALSERYHSIIRKLRLSNKGLGAVVGLALSLALIGIFVLSYEVVAQYPNYGQAWHGIIIVLAIGVGILIIYSLGTVYKHLPAAVFREL
jgi:hypothetical protein